MFVSRKYLSLIHFFPRELTSRVNVPEFLVECVDFTASHPSGDVPLEPLATRIVKSAVFLTSRFATEFNLILFSAQCDVLHTTTVYTISVHTATVLIIPQAQAELDRAAIPCIIPPVLSHARLLSEVSGIGP